MDAGNDDSLADVLEQAGSFSEAARRLGIHEATVRRRAAKLGLKSPRLPGQAFLPGSKMAKPIPVSDPLPPDDIPVEDLLQVRKARFERALAHHAAKRWREFRVPADGPYALMFFGDPHVDDDGCNWPLLERHAALAARTEGLYAVNIGDTTNNWSGRLARLWANQSSSAADARRIAKHFLGHMGIPWFLWLHGNHDLWDGPVGAEWFEAIRPHFVELEQTAMEEWQAKVTLVSPNGFRLRLWAAHDFKGNSLWNPLHGPLRGAQMRDWAHLYVCGHKHSTGLMNFENAERRFYAWLVRARGYKWLDSYADQHGFPAHEAGASVLAVVDPDARKVNAVHCFLDPFEGVEFLAWKRRRA